MMRGWGCARARVGLKLGLGFAFTFTFEFALEVAMVGDSVAGVEGGYVCAWGGCCCPTDCVDMDGMDRFLVGVGTRVGALLVRRLRCACASTSFAWASIMSSTASSFSRVLSRRSVLFFSTVIYSTRRERMLS